MMVSMALGALATNCFIITESDRAVVIDPASSEEVLTYLENNELTLGAIIITHGHYDHFAGAECRVIVKFYPPQTDCG